MGKKNQVTLRTWTRAGVDADLWMLLKEGFKVRGKRATRAWTPLGALGRALRTHAGAPFCCAAATASRT